MKPSFEFRIKSERVMGCPPDPMEVSLYQNRERVSESQSHLHELRTQANRVKNLLERILPFLEPENPYREKIIYCVGIPVAPPSETEKLVPLNSTNFESDMENSYRHSDQLEAEIKQMENRLCEAREYLLASNPKSLDAALQAEISAEIPLHEAHRKDDLQTWLDWLTEKKGMCEYYLNESEDSKSDSYRIEGDDTDYAARLDKIVEEISRVTALKPKDFLLNRNSFGQNPEDFWNTVN